MKKITKFFLAIYLCVFLFGFVLEAQTATFKDSGTKMSTFAKGLKFSNFDDATSNIIGNVMILVNTLFFIFMIYAGILWLSSSGEEGKIEKAKSILMWCVIGMVVAFGSYAITTFILNRVS